MDVLLLGLSVVLCFVFCFILCITLYIHVQHRQLAHIPGPPRNGIKGFYLGQVVEIMTKERHFAEMLYQWHVEYGHVYKMFVLHHPLVVTSDQTAIKDLLVTGGHPKAGWAFEDMYSLLGQRFMGHGLATELNHETWAKRRQQMNPIFNRGYLKSITGSFNSTADALIEELTKVADGKTNITMLEYMNRVTLDVIGKVAFGMDINSLKDKSSPFPKAIFMTLSGLSFAMYEPVEAKFMPWAKKEFKNEVRHSLKLLRKTGRELLEKREEQIKRGETVPEDILAQVCRYKANDPDFDLEAALDDFVTFFVAGQETTANTMAFILMECGRNPDVMQRLRDEVDSLIGDRENITYEDVMGLEYAGMVMKESMRLCPPAPTTFREITAENYEILGYKIPKGTGAAVSTYALSRLECYHKDPLTFDPERFHPDSDRKPPMYTYFPFLIGPRNCLGQTFAQIEAKLLLAKFVQKFDLELDMTQSFEIGEKVTLRPRDGCRCTLKLRAK